MSDSFTIRPSQEARALPNNEYWQIAREVKKQEAVYPKQSRAMIQSAVALAFAQSGKPRDPEIIDRYIAMYLTGGQKP